MEHDWHIMRTDSKSFDLSDGALRAMALYKEAPAG
jgi:hypothetical protein